MGTKNTKFFKKLCDSDIDWTVVVKAMKKYHNYGEWSLEK